MPPAQVHMSPIPPTVADREAELAALQTAFDEYIASSRELEDELDAELAKMQEKLAESSAANAALAAQLENVTPQLSSLERALSDAKSKLEVESNARRKAELSQDEAEARAREAEGSLAALQAENAEALEELAFRDEEVEELKLELEVEKERQRVEVEEMATDLAEAKAKLKARAEKETTVQRVAVDGQPDSVVVEDGDKGESGKVKEQAYEADDESGDIVDGIDESVYGRSSADDEIQSDLGVTGDENDEYIRSLEDELEDVTEQLIDIETRLSETEGKLADAEKSKNDAHAKVADLEAKLEKSQQDAADSASKDGETVSSEQQSRDEDEKDRKERQAVIAQLQDDKRELVEKNEIQREEIEIVKEELAMTKDELKALEEDTTAKDKFLDNIKSNHKDEISKISADLEKAKGVAKSAEREVSGLEKALEDATNESSSLKEELDLLNKALKNSKSDHAAVLDEMDALKAAYDSVEDEERLRKEMIEAHSKEVEDLKVQIDGLDSANASLKRRLDELENTTDSKQEVDRAEETKKALERTEKDLQVARRQLKETSAKLAEAEAKNERAQALTPPPSPRPSKDRVDRALTLSPRWLQLSLPKVDMTTKNGEDERDDGPSESDFYRSHARSRKRAQHTSSSRGRSSSPSTIQRLERDLDAKEGKTRDLTKQCKALKDQNRMSEVKVKSLQADLRNLQEKLTTPNGDVPMNAARNDSPAMALKVEERDDIDEEEEEEANIDEVLASEDSERIATEFRTLAKKSFSMKEHNANLLQKILSLQGNIQVTCRIRPIKVSELRAGMRGVVEPLSETEVGCFDSRTKSWKSYAFDKVWGPDTTQRGVFQDVEPLALSVVDGYNTCIFAYGQTGSGKTYTMEGMAETGQLGISHRTIKKLFTLLDQRARQAEENLQNDETGEAESFSFVIDVSMLEIYNEQVYDLLSKPLPDLASSSKKPSLDIRRGADNLIEVPGLTKEKVRSLSDVMQVLKKGNNNRATAATDLNEHSSRSHMVLNIKVTTMSDGQPQNKGNLFLVDLAGSERVRRSGVMGKELKEAGHINKSLSALGNVMEALDRKSSHVPFRDSKLTYLLQDSLGGNSRTMMVVAVGPTNESFDETQNSLQFATRVRRINLGAAQRNVTSKNLEETVKNLTSEMKLLSKAKERSEEQMHSLKRENTRIQERLQLASASRAKNNDETRTLAALRKNSTEMTARWQKEKALRDEKAADLEGTQKELKRVQQQLQRAANEKELLGRKLEDKEQALSVMSDQLRTAKESSQAANLRARKAEMLRNSRNTAPRNGGQGSFESNKPKRTRTSSRKKSEKIDAARKSRKEKRENSSATTGSNPSTNENGTSSAAQEQQQPARGENADEVREKVFQMLQRYDPGKVDKIGKIMDKFRGRESDLLQKMIDRYEGDNASVTSLGSSKSVKSTSANAQQRSEMAMARHKERMARMRAKRSTSLNSNSGNDR